MTTIGDLKISRMAINVIDLEKANPQLAKEVFPLIEENKVINSFFKKHFLDTRQGRSTKSCTFIDKDASVKIKIDRYSEDESDDAFLQLSGELTTSLFKIMQNSSSRSSGTFFVCEVLVNDQENFIFLIKLDPKDGVQINYENLTLEVLENVLPDSNDRVHKCAIIRYNKSEDHTADLFVMDKQQREGETAKFFLETYLQATEMLNDEIMTRHAINETKEKLLAILPEVDPNKLFQSIDREFTNGSRIQLTDVINNVLNDHVPMDKKDRELYIEKQSQNFVHSFVEKFPDHQTAFTTSRKDAFIVYRGNKDELYFKFTKTIIEKVEIDNDDEGNTIIKVDKDIEIKRELK